MGKSRNSDQDEQFVHLNRPPPTNKKQKQRTKKKEPMKITYISSPTLVKATNASEFRALVQELTGKDSRVGEEESYDYYSPVISVGSVEDHNQMSCTSGVDELDCNDYFVAPEDGYLSNNGGGGGVTATAAEEETASYSAVEMEEGGFSLWRDVPDAFGNQYSLNCVFV